MADIKQAAEWMQEGKKVRRPRWPKYLSYYKDDEGFIISEEYDNGPAVFDYDELLADDWELAEEATSER